MDLLVIRHVVLREDALNLLEVPVGDARHLIDVLDRPSHVPVLAVRPIDAEAVAVVVALADAHAVAATTAGVALVAARGAAARLPIHVTTGCAIPVPVEVHVLRAAGSRRATALG